ncbi:hypothetical protein CC80DRAFT_546428 [Byssothecium circinans]|uniref:Uncharacterized protein n=1 Tax=Byssothecium circinans TaxID=147558 RepID=A0A6A5U0J5_9PLEO|nr:hypothetical protein CC80DRAFT_546428 [Byssothecium circinans]
MALLNLGYCGPNILDVHLTSPSLQHQPWIQNNARLRPENALHRVGTTRSDTDIHTLIARTSYTAMDFRVRGWPRKDIEELATMLLARDLKHLHIVVEYGPLYKTPFRPQGSFMKLVTAEKRFEEVELVEIESLRKLKVPVDALIHRNYDKRRGAVLTNPDYEKFFPASLQELTITNPDSKTLVWLRDMRLRRVLKNIKVVELCCGWNWGKPIRWFEKNRQVLDALRGDGIKVKLSAETKIPGGWYDRVGLTLWDAEWAEEEWSAALFTA